MFLFLGLFVEMWILLFIRRWRGFVRFIYLFFRVYRVRMFLIFKGEEEIFLNISSFRVVIFRGI